MVARTAPASSPKMETQLTGIPENEVTEHPRYSMPTIGSLLPSYKNADIEQILAAFSKAAFQNIQDLPATLTSQAVLRNKRARQELANLMGAGCSMTQAHSIDYKPKTLFSHFPHMVDEFEAKRQQDNVDRARSHAAQSRISSKDFVLSCNSGTRQPWLDNFVEGATYPYMSSPYEAQDIIHIEEAWKNRLAVLKGAFIPACTGQHLSEALTKADQHTMQKALVGIIHADWPGAQVELYENVDKCWMVKVALSSVDSPHGLAAYLAVLLRNDGRVRSYRLTKVVEHWNITPGDGSVYFALRPPWVAQTRTEAFFALHPDQRSYRTSVTFKQALKTEKHALSYESD